jgi:hypothetical protein
MNENERDVLCGRGGVSNVERERERELCGYYSVYSLTINLVVCFILD